MALVLPKIVYPSGGGSTLNFDRPPTDVAAYEYEDYRHDNYSSAGVKESIHQRIDQFYEFTLEWESSGANIDAWATFMAYALQGGTFDYYPDGTSGTHFLYELMDTKWKAARHSLGMYSFKFKMRLAVSWP